MVKALWRMRTEISIEANGTQQTTRIGKSDHFGSPVCRVRYARMEEERSVLLPNITLSKFDFSIMEQNITAAQSFYRTSVVSVGIFMNCVVLFVISFSRQLHYPRHIFWAAVSIFEFLLLIDSAFELVAVHNRDELACLFVVLFYPSDYSSLLLCLSLSAFDRYLSIVHNEWYKAKVTNGNVVLLISIAIFLTIVVFTSPFWTGYKSIYTCTSNFILIYWASLWNFFLGIVCVVLHCKIFIETKTLIQRYVPKYRRTPVTVTFLARPPSVRQPRSGPNVESRLTSEQVLLTFPGNHSNTRGENLSIFSLDAQLPSPAAHRQMSMNEYDLFHPPVPSESVNNQNDTAGSSWKSNRSKISRLEVQAALNLSVNILPFWLCTFPVACYSIALYWCMRLEANCDGILLTWNYFWDVFIFHTIYNPIMYMATCSEFQRAFIHIVKKLSIKFNAV